MFAMLHRNRKGDHTVNSYIKWIVGMTPKKLPWWKPEYDELAEYNARRHKGIMHDEWQMQRMKKIQSDFDEDLREYLFNKES